MQHKQNSKNSYSLINKVKNDKINKPAGAGGKV